MIILISLHYTKKPVFGEKSGFSRGQDFFSPVAGAVQNTSRFSAIQVSRDADLFARGRYSCMLCSCMLQYQKPRGCGRDGGRPGRNIISPSWSTNKPLTVRLRWVFRLLGIWMDNHSSITYWAAMRRLAKPGCDWRPAYWR